MRVPSRIVTTGSRRAFLLGGLLLLHLLTGCARAIQPSSSIPGLSPSPIAPAGPARSASASTTSEVIVAGWVIHHETCARLPGALTILHCEGARSVEQSTDDGGAFVFRDVPPGACTLQVLIGNHNRTLKLQLKPGERRLLDYPMDPNHRFTIDPDFSKRGEVN